MWKSFENIGLQTSEKVSWGKKKETCAKHKIDRSQNGRSNKGRTLAYYGHTMRKQGSCLQKEIMQRTMPGARRRGRPRTAWMDNINTWTGLPVKESVRMTENRNKWSKYVLGSRTAKEQNISRIW